MFIIFYKKFSDVCQDKEAKVFFVELMNEEEEHRKLVEAQLEKLSDVSKVPMNSIQISYRTAFRKHNFKNERDGITLRF